MSFSEINAESNTTGFRIVEEPQDQGALAGSTNHSTIMKTAKVAGGILLVGGLIGGLITAGVFLAPHLTAIGGALGSFFMSNAGFAAMGGLGGAATGLAVGVYKHNQAKQLKEELQRAKDQNSDDIQLKNRLLEYLKVNNNGPTETLINNFYQAEDIAWKEQVMRDQLMGTCTDQEIDRIILTQRESIQLNAVRDRVNELNPITPPQSHPRMKRD